MGEGGGGGLPSAMDDLEGAAAEGEREDERLEVRISGSGGQGILLAAAVLADAVAAAGREVVQTQSYGPEARGGASQAEVIAATEPIDYPEVDLADISLCLSQAAFDRYGRQTRPGGLLLYDGDLVDEGDVAGFRLLGLPFTRTATSDVGNKVVTNIVALGALTAFIPWLTMPVVGEAVAARVPERFRDLDLRALEAGRRLVEQGEARVSRSDTSAGPDLEACEPCGDER